jgi:hypothetical protein
MLISKRSFLNLTRSKIGIIRIWEKRRTEGVEKSASRIIRAARFWLCSRRMRSKSVFEQFPQVTEHVKTLHFKANCMDFFFNKRPFRDPYDRIWFCCQEMRTYVSREGQNAYSDHSYRTPSSMPKSRSDSSSGAAKLLQTARKYAMRSNEFQRLIL